MMILDQSIDNCIDCASVDNFCVGFCAKQEQEHIFGSCGAGVISERYYFGIEGMERDIYRFCKREHGAEGDTFYNAPRISEKTSAKLFELEESRDFSEEEEDSMGEEFKNSEKPRPKRAMYSCSFPGCDGLFNSMSNRKRHEKLHSGEKPHRCDYMGCGKSFARKYDLKVHVRTHTKEKPYTCEVIGCGKRFSRNSSLREHERNIHNLCLGQKMKNRTKNVITPLDPNNFTWYENPKLEQEKFKENVIKEEQASPKVPFTLDSQSRAQVRELVSLFQSAHACDIASGDVEIKSSLPRELVANLLEMKKERPPTKDLDTLAPLQHTPEPVSTLPTLQSSLQSLIYPNNQYKLPAAMASLYNLHLPARLNAMQEEMETENHSLLQDLLDPLPMTLPFNAATSYMNK